MTTILVCTDGSEPALHAARSGLALLVQHDRVVALTVISPPDESLLAGTSGFAGGVVSVDEFEDMEASAQAAGAAVARELAEHLTADGVTGVEALVAVGDAGTALCQVADDLGAAAIVMGSRGRSGIKRAMLGSVSDHVVRNAPCPVVIVGPHDEG